MRAAFLAVFLFFLASPIESCLKLQQAGDCPCRFYPLDSYNAAATLKSADPTLYETWWSEYAHWSVFPARVTNGTNCEKIVDCGDNPDLGLFVFNNEGVTEHFRSNKLEAQCVDGSWKVPRNASFDGNNKLFAFCTNGVTYCNSTCDIPVGINADYVANKLATSAIWNATFVSQKVSLSAVLPAYSRRDESNCPIDIHCDPSAIRLLVLDGAGNFRFHQTPLFRGQGTLYEARTSVKCMDSCEVDGRVEVNNSITGETSFIDGGVAGVCVK